MVMPHTGRTDSAEGNIVDGDVAHGIVDASSTRMGVRQYVIGSLLIVVEVVKSQWTRAIIDVIDGFIQCIVGFDQQQGAKNFVLFDQHVRRGIQNQSDGHLAGAFEGFIGRVDRYNASPLGLGILQIILQAIVLALVDDGGVILIVPH